VQILFVGAEITQVYAHRHGSRQKARSQASAATAPSPIRAAAPSAVPPSSTQRPLPTESEPAAATDHSGRHVAVYNAGVAVGVAAGRLLRRRRHDGD
jgi:hypothetical protein